MRNLRYLALLVLAISVPTLIFAQSQGIVPCDGTDCTTGSVVTLANNILRFLIGISVLLATIMIAWGGFKMVTSAGNSGEVSKGREMMTNAIIGIIITLAAWLLIDTVMKLVLKDPDSWKSIIDDVGQNTPTPGQKPSGDVPQSSGTPTPSGGGTVVGGGQLTHDGALSALNEAGIPVVATGGKIQADCSQTSGCTSLQGVNAGTIQDAIDLKNDCQCNVTITGGTETTGGHSDSATGHTAGYKYDAAKNSALDSYIKTNYQYSGTRSDGATLYKAADGSVYADEGNHWDVLVPA